VAGRDDYGGSNVFWYFSSSQRWDYTECCPNSLRSERPKSACVWRWGAQGSDIAGLLACRGGAQALAGLLIGFAGSFALTRYLRSLLYGVTPNDPLAYGTVAIVMLAATAVAMTRPARQAIRSE
jgi:hypothetical protein